MGIALAGELNGYPGPAHVLELASMLDLSKAQHDRTQELFEEMQKTAILLVTELLATETELDPAFVDGDVKDASLHRILADTAASRASSLYASQI